MTEVKHKFLKTKSVAIVGCPFRYANEQTIRAVLDNPADSRMAAAARHVPGQCALDLELNLFVAPRWSRYWTYSSRRGWCC